MWAEGGNEASSKGKVHFKARRNAQRYHTQGLREYQVEDDVVEHVRQSTSSAATMAALSADIEQDSAPQRIPRRPGRRGVVQGSAKRHHTWAQRAEQGLTTQRTRRESRVVSSGNVEQHKKASPQRNASNSKALNRQQQVSLQGVSNKAGSEHSSYLARWEPGPR